MLALHTSITSYISLTVCSVHCLWLSEERKWMASLLSLRMKQCCFGILCWSSQELRSKLKWQADRFRLGHTWACLSGMRCWGLKPHNTDLWPFYQCFYVAIGPQSQMCRLLQWPQACNPALLLSSFSQILRKNPWILRGTLKRWVLCCTIWWPPPFLKLWSIISRGSSGELSLPSVLWRLCLDKLQISSRHTRCVHTHFSFHLMIEYMQWVENIQ